MASTTTAKCGKDGFPKFPDQMLPADAEKVDGLRRRLAELKIAIKNSNETAAARAQNDETRNGLQQKHQAELAAKQKLLDEAAKLFFEISDRNIMKQSMGTPSASAQSAIVDVNGNTGRTGNTGNAGGLDMDTVRRMCEASAAMALARHAHSMQQSMQQSTQPMLADGDVLEKKLDGVVDLAARKMAEVGDGRVVDKAAKLYLNNPSNTKAVREEVVAKITEEVEESEDEMDAIRTKIKKDIVRSEDEMAEIRAEIKADLENDSEVMRQIRYELKKDTFEESDDEMDTIRAEIKKDLESDPNVMRQIKHELKEEGFKASLKRARQAGYDKAMQRARQAGYDEAMQDKEEEEAAQEIVKKRLLDKKANRAQKAYVD